MIFNCFLNSLKMDIMSITGVRWKLFYLSFLIFVGAYAEELEVKQEYQNKFIRAKQQLTSIYQHSRERSHINLELSKQWTQSLNDLSLRTNALKGSIHFMRAHNKTLLSLGLDLWEVEQGALDKAATFPADYPHSVSFVKGVQWQDRLFFIICLENNKCNLFTAFQGYDFHFCQSISDIPGVPVAAEFFPQGGNLFLVVLFQAEHSRISQTILYRWEKTYMDRQFIPEITTTASTVIVFSYKESTIFILGCTGDDRIKFPSQVWRRELNGDIRKVQYLPTWKLLSLTLFVERGEHFLLALEEDKGAIYWWEGDEFVHWLPVEKMMSYFSVSVSRNPISPTFIIFSRDNSIYLYVMTSENLEKVFESTLSDEISISSAYMYYEEEKIYLTIQYKILNRVYLSLYKLSVKKIPKYPEEPAALQNPKSMTQEALYSISHGLEVLDEQLIHLDSILHTLLLTNRDITISPNVTIFSETIEIQSGDIFNLSNIVPSIAISMQDLLSKIQPLQKEINIYSNNIKFVQRDHNKHLVIMGDVHLKQAKINSLTSDIVNDDRFEPSLLMKWKNGPVQRISNVKAKNITANWLLLKQIGKKMVEDLFMDDWEIKVPVRTSFLKSGNLEFNNDSMINSITVKALIDKQVTTYTGEEARNMIPQIESDEGEDKATLQLQDFTVIENLNVETINSISINDLMSSLVVKEKINKVNGNVHFTNGLRTNKLIGRINQRPIRYEQFTGTKKPYQPPDVYFQPPWDGAMQNGAQLNPQMYSVYRPAVVRKARSEDPEKKKNPTRKISAKVKVIGNLKVRRLKLQNSSLHINSHSVPTSNLHEVFWTYSSPQVIGSSVNFSQGVSLSRGLENPFVNGINLSQCATRKSIFKRLILKNINIDGDFVLKDNFMKQNKYNKHKFQDFNVLEIKHLQTKYINERYMENILQLHHLLDDRLRITAKNVSVEGDLKADFINGINIHKKFQDTVFIDEDTILSNLHFENVSANQVQVKILNGFPADQFLGLESPEEKSKVYIRGNIHIAKLSEVKLINNKTVNLSLVVDRTKENTIYGKKIFLGQVVSTNHITIENLNGMNAEYMFNSLLRTSSDQVITGFYTIKRANIDTLSNVTKVNGIDISRILYTDQPQINIYGDISFKSVIVEGHIVSNSVFEGCTLPKVEESLLFPNHSRWSTLTVGEDCNWKQSSAIGRIQHLLDSAVTVDSSQTITGDIIISHLFSKSIQVNSLNDKNITFIFHDSLYRNKNDQVFSGKKSFLGQIICDSIDVRGDARFKSVNDVNINYINERLIRHQEDDDVSNRPISGHKKFLFGFAAFFSTLSRRN